KTKQKKKTLKIPTKLQVDDELSSDLKSMVYYLSTKGFADSNLTPLLRGACTQKEITDRDIVRLCTFALHERRKGMPAHRSLGLEDDNVRENSLLVKELRRQAEARG